MTCFRTLALMAVLLVALTGCETLFGKSKDEAGSAQSAEAGERIAVLENTRQLVIDQDLAGRTPAIAAPLANRDWPQPGGNAAHTLPHVALTGDGSKRWQAGIGDGSSRTYKLLAAPVIKDGRIYAMDARGQVAAFAVTDGRRLWRFDTTPEDSDHDAIGGGVTASGDRIFATTGYGEVLALNARDGKLLWRREVGKPYRGAPTASGDQVYAVSIDNELKALSVRTGDILWSHSAVAESATLMGAASPAVSGDIVIAAYSSGELFSLRAQNGRVIWSDALAVSAQVGALPAIADIRGLPVIVDGRAYAISHSGRMVAIDLRSGERVWENDIGGTNTPVVSGDTVFVISNDNELMALTRESGRVIWIKALARLEDPNDRDSDPVFWSGPVLAGGRLWLTNSLGELASFSFTDGTRLSGQRLADSFFIPPVVAANTLYVLSDDGDLFALK